MGRRNKRSKNTMSNTWYKIEKCLKTKGVEDIMKKKSA